MARHSPRRRGPELRCRARAGALAVTLAIGVAAATSHAAPPESVETAGTLYDRAVAAQRRGDYARAASLFARADELAPDATALEAAINAAVLADDPALAMALVQRAGRSTMPPGLASASRAAEAKLGSRAGMLRIKCSDCSARVDGDVAPINEDRWLVVGSHRVELAVGDRQEVFEVQIAARTRAEIAPSFRLGTSTGPGEDGDLPQGLSPAWFWVGFGLTALCATFAIASGVDTLNQHAEFDQNRTPEAARDGEAAETRTYVLWAFTGALAAGTAAIGLFAVRWNDEPKPGAAVTSTASVWTSWTPDRAGARAPSFGGGGVSVRTRF